MKMTLEEEKRIARRLDELPEKEFVLVVMELGTSKEKAEELYKQRHGLDFQI